MGFGGGTRRKAGSILGLLLLATATPAFSQEKERSHQERFATPQSLREREEREASRRLRVNPNDAKALDNRGVARLRLGKVDEAVADLKRAVALDPKSADARADLAYGLMQQRRWPESLAAARSALALDPNHIAANAYAGHILVQSGGDVSEAIASLERAASRSPDDVDVRIDLLNANLQRHELGRAGMDLRVLRLLLPYGDARLAYEEGLLQAEQGNLEIAIERFRRALAADAKLNAARHSLGLALAQTGRWQEAIKLLGPLSQAEPQSFAIAYFHALALHNAQRAEAETEARRAVTLRPQSAEGQALLGIILASQGKKEEAIPYLRRARELDPANFVATFALGRLLSDGGQMEEGLALLREAIKQAPESANAHLALAGALRRAGKLKEAEQEAQTAESLKQQQQNEGSEAPR
ncbi:MAG: tetratricopeptide repeat protein [Terriglobales bacterium]